LFILFNQLVYNGKETLVI